MAHYIALAGEHRIFGCYVRRNLRGKAEDDVYLSLSQTDDITKIKSFRRAERYYQHSTIGRTNRDVMVYIDSFFYLGSIGEQAMTEVNEWNDYFKRQFPIHLGFHAVCLRYGGLCATGLALLGNGELFIWGVHPFNAIYPVIKDVDYVPNNWTQELLLGLHYKPYWDYYDLRPSGYNGFRDAFPPKENIPVKVDGSHYTAAGARYFHRCQSMGKPNPTLFRNMGLNCGNVFEVSEQSLISGPVMEKFEHKVSDERNYHKRVAFYVCAGAKLYVIDNFNKDKDKSNVHNRSLILPGGLVIVDETDLHFELNMGKTGFTGKVDMEGSEDSKAINAVWASLSSMVRRLEENEKKYEVIRNTECPVIFLGATESKYNSVVWKVYINRHVSNSLRPSDDPPGMPWFIQFTKDRNFAILRRTTYFTAPENGRIVAIESWDGYGRMEIVARHRYQQLHRGVTRLKNVNSRVYLHKDYQNFVAPEQPMLTRIISQSRDTEYFCDYSVYKRTDQKSLLTHYKPTSAANTEYYFSRITNISDKLEHTGQVPVPAAYPPVKIGNEFFYLPQMFTTSSGKVYDLTDVSSHYNRRVVNKIEIEGKTLTLSAEKETVPIHVWTRLYKEMVEPDNTNWKTVENNDSLKLGVDGHWYFKYDKVRWKGQNINNPRIGTMETQYYQ